MKNLVRIAAIIVLVGMTLGTAAAQPEPFVDWHETFESGTEGWITDSTPGEEGWCGDVEHRDASSGSVEPSEGSGYGVVRTGVCNEYWQEALGSGETGPYTPGGGYPRAWPNAGYAIELDVHLDRAAGTAFTVAASVFLLDPEASGAPLRYFFAEVVPEGDGWRVFGQDQDLADGGWHTLRITFGDEDGALTVEAELLRVGEVVASAPLTTTAISGEATSSFDVADLGTGYLWFESIGEGTDLAIDEVRGRAID